MTIIKKYLFFSVLLPTLLMGGQDYIKLSDQISDPFVREYCQRNGLSVMGLGGGMMNDIDLIILTFKSHEQMDIAAARRLYIDGVEDLLNRYNNSRVVRKYLHHFPFNLNALDFGIVFKGKGGSWFSKKYISFAFNVKDNIHYDYFDHELNDFVNCFIEPYVDAVRVVHAEREQVASHLDDNADHL